MKYIIAVMLVLGVTACVMLGFIFFCSFAKSEQQSEYPENGPYMTHSGGQRICAIDSPWEKEMGGTEFFWVSSTTNKELVCSLWTGSTHDFARYNAGLAFKSVADANKFLKRNWVRQDGELYISEANP